MITEWVRLPTDENTNIANFLPKPHRKILLQYNGEYYTGFFSDGEDGQRGFYVRQLIDVQFVGISFVSKWIYI